MEKKTVGKQKEGDGSKTEEGSWRRGRWGRGGQLEEREMGERRAASERRDEGEEGSQ